MRNMVVPLTGIRFCCGFLMFKVGFKNKICIGIIKVYKSYVKTLGKLISNKYLYNDTSDLELS
jgi:hypothetical protein